MKRKLLQTSKLLICALAGIATASCGNKNGEVKTAENKADSVKIAAEKVEVMLVAEQTIDRSVEYPSTLNPFEEIYLVPASPGRIEKIYVEVGNHVSKGQMLVQMDRTQLSQAEVQLQTLKTDYKRLDTLVKLGSIAQQQYDQLKSQYEVAQTNVNFLRENTQLLAPFAGVVAGKYFEDGEMYSGTPNTAANKAAIVYLAQIDNLKALANVPEQYYPQVKTGMTVKITADVYPGQTFEGKVFRIYPIIDAATHSFQVEISVPSKGLLRPGMFSRVSFELGQVNTIIVPAAAVLKMQGSNDRYVFVARADSAKRIGVRIGKRFDDMVELISDEVKIGDRLVVGGQARLFDGMSIEIVDKQ
ncbi:MAG: efflux RND transporter periplasmic adaptor subunit [Prevotellaceae bacterium]|jgi:RND family efflux transporter MFP subunit|nr:efflux RND transporter periplasmic adaptor subunit [Prevotellaceae bacterium]